jgi:purine-binding chemotaxis protein CheW
MDFLSIRKKARERAQAREAAQPSGPPADASGRSATPAPEPEPGIELELDPGPPAWRPDPPLGHEAPAAEAEPRAAPDAGASPFAERRRSRVGESAADASPPARETQERLAGLAPSPDGRFATWRPGAGPPPVEPDPRAWSPPADRRPEEPGREPPAEPSLEPEPIGGWSAPPRPVAPQGRARSPDPEDPLDLFFYRPDEEAALVPALGGGASEEAQLQAPVELHEFLTFLLGSEEYAVPIEHVREVLRAPAITEVPRAPTHVLGVVTVRGEVVAVIDTRGRLGLGGESTGARIVIVDAGEGPLGLLVDAVTSVVRLPSGSIEPCPQGISTAASECVIGIGRQRDRLFMVVDAAALLPRDRQAKGR